MLIINSMRMTTLLQISHLLNASISQPPDSFFSLYIYRLQLIKHMHSSGRMAIDKQNE